MGLRSVCFHCELSSLFGLEDIFKLCQGLLTRWLFNLSPVATLLISKLFSGEKRWYMEETSWKGGDISRDPGRAAQF